MSILVSRIGKYFKAFLLLLVVILLSLNMFPRIEISDNPYGKSYMKFVFNSYTYSPGGDGFDEGAFDWVNLKEVSEYLSQIYNFEYDSDVVLCIIDTGLMVGIWKHINKTLGLEAAQSIQYWYCESSGAIHGPFKFKKDSLRAIIDQECEDDSTQHGSSIVYLIKRFAPRIKLLVIGTPAFSISDGMGRLADILAKIYNGEIYYDLSGREKIPDVISISYSWPHKPPSNSNINKKKYNDQKRDLRDIMWKLYRYNHVEFFYISWKS